MLRYGFFSAHQDNVLLTKLYTCLNRVSHTCVLGSPNKIEDFKKTNAWNFYLLYRYHHLGQYYSIFNRTPLDIDKDIYIKFDAEKKSILHQAIKHWFFHTDYYHDVSSPHIIFSPRDKELDPLKDPEFNLNQNHHFPLILALLAEETRMGNCEIKSSLFIKYLWENPKNIHRIELILDDPLDHVFVVINRSGILQDMDTWEEAFVIDPWYQEGIIMPVKDFKKKLVEIKDYIIVQNKDLNNIGVYKARNFYGTESSFQCLCEIIPSIHRYPSYEKNYYLENYYDLVNAYPENLCQNRENISPLLNDLNLLKEMFNLSLEQIKQPIKLNAI